MSDWNTKTILCCIALSTLFSHRLIAEESIKVGVILPQTGAFARYGARIQRAIEGSSDGSVKFIYEDEGCDPKTAVSAYKKLSEFDHVKYFLGPWCGSPQSVIAPLLENGRQLALLGSSAPQSVFLSSGKRMFSTQPSIEAESTFLANQLDKRGIKSVAVVFKENQFSRAHEAAFKVAFKGHIERTFAYDSDGLSDLKAIALQIKRINPEAIYVPDSFPLMAGFVREVRAIGVNKIPIVSVYSAQSEDVLETLGQDGEGVIYSYPDIEEDALDQFPALAVRILVGTIRKCRGDVQCAQNEFLSNAGFDRNGVYAGNMILKTIRDGKFVVIRE